MNIQPSTSRERRLIFIEALLNETDKVSKVAPNTSLSGIASGVAKVSGKAEKDIIIALSELFPDLSYGSQLDRAGKNLGIPQRLGALGSSTYVRVTADPGTVYIPGTHVFTSTSGPTFNIDGSDQITVPQEGFTYIKVSSVQTGSIANVAALTISQCTPQPTGHLNVVNEFMADFGRDSESDEQFRTRIQDGGNILARGTVAMIEQLAFSVNSKVLKCWNYGVDLNGQRVIGVVTQNGSDLSQTELDNLTAAVGDFLTLTDSQWNGTTNSGILFRNAQYYPIDISTRVVLDNTANPDDVRQNIQLGISKYFDFRTFDPSKTVVQWDRLLNVVQNTPGVKYAPDQYFYPSTDIAVGAYLLPRLRGFLMLNIDGTVISNITGTLSPIYYPAQADFSFISTILQAI